MGVAVEDGLSTLNARGAKAMIVQSHRKKVSFQLSPTCHAAIVAIHLAQAAECRQVSVSGWLPHPSCASLEPADSAPSPARSRKRLGSEWKRKESSRCRCP